jgi:hypothetical protein
MALEKTWQYALNQPITGISTVAGLSKAQILSLKNGLLGNGVTFTDQSGAVIDSPKALWAMYASCDGTTAGTMNDGVDRIGVDPAKLVRAAAGVAHSWFVLKSPLMSNKSFTGAYFYLIVDVSGADDQRMAQVVMSKAAPTGGSTTARPTATDEWVISPANTYWNANTITTGHVNFVLSTEGSWFWYWIPGNLNIPTNTFAALLMEDVYATDQYPLFCWQGYYTAGGDGVMSRALQILYWANYGTNYLVRNRTHDGSALTDQGVIFPVRGSGASGFTDFTAASFGTYSGDYQTRYMPDFPCWVISLSTGYYGLRGRLPDMFITGNNLPGFGSARLSTPLGPVEYVDLGGFLYPSNSSIVLSY